jgi:hypothetical protein
MRKDQREKTDKTKHEYEEEKYGGECTFAPNINSKKTDAVSTISVNLHCSPKRE